MEDSYKKKLSQIRTNEQLKSISNFQNYSDLDYSQAKNLEKSMEGINKTRTTSSTALMREAVFSQNKISALFKALGSALKARKEAEKGMNAPWGIAIAAAIAIDGADFIPIAGWMITLIARPFIFIFLFGNGRWWKKRIIRRLFLMLAIDSIPPFNFLPLTIISVLMAYRQTKREFKQKTEEEENVKKLANKNIKIENNKLKRLMKYSGGATRWADDYSDQLKKAA